MNDHLADAFDEAARGLLHSAVESFEAAIDREGPAAVLGAAVCRLLLEEPDEAILLLETRVQEIGPEWAARHAWLAAVARARAGDPLGAELAAARLPEPWRRRLLTSLRLRSGDLRGGVSLLLGGRRRSRSTVSR